MGLLSWLGIGSLTYNLGKEAVEKARPARSHEDITREMIEKKFPNEESRKIARAHYGVSYPGEEVKSYVTRCQEALKTGNYYGGDGNYSIDGKKK